MASEATPLVLHSAPSTMDFAKRQSPTLTKLLGSLQAVLVFFFLFGTTYNSRDYSAGEYVIFRDIMLLLGFGFLMTFLGHYGLGAVGLTMMLTALAVQLNVFVELGCRYLAGDEDAAFPLPLDVPVFIDGEFSAATLLISYGAVIGRASPVQLVIMALFQSFFYAVNKVVFVLGLGGCRRCWRQYDNSHVWCLFWARCFQGTGAAQTIHRIQRGPYARIGCRGHNWNNVAVGLLAFICRSNGEWSASQ